AGAVTVKVPTRALRVVGRGEGSTPSPRPSASQPSPMRDEGRVRGKTKAEVGPELHLIGRTADEARETLEKYLDDAFLAGLPSVRIIHGKGTGTLRRAVHELLARHPLVAEHRVGALHEGGEG